MSDLPTLLPPNAQPIEYALEQFSSRQAGLPLPTTKLWNVDSCPATLLPWLAWALSVDNWDASWPEGTKRAAVAASIEIHRRKGSVASVRDAVAAFGFGVAAIVEGWGGYIYDGTLTYDGAETYGAPDHWAEYRVYLVRPITIAQAEQLRAILKNVAPARCHLAGLHFTEVAHTYDGTIDYDGAYSYGVA